MSARVAMISGVVLVAIGIVVGGVVGGLAAIAAVGLGWLRGHRSVAAGALVALIAAALLTAFEAPATAEPSDYLFDFARDRPLAAAAGLVAGIFTVVAVVLAAIVEREASSTRAAPGAPDGAPVEGTAEEDTSR